MTYGTFAFNSSEQLVNSRFYLMAEVASTLPVWETLHHWRALSWVCFGPRDLDPRSRFPKSVLSDL